MKTTTLGKKLLALVISVLLIAAVFPLAAAADGGEFVSENLLLTKLDADNSHGILFDHRGKTVSSSTNGGISANGVVAGLVDGNTEVAHDIWGMSSNYSWGEGYNWYGVQYKLTEASFASHVTIYADYAGMEHRYAVYASDSETDLYLGINLMGAVTCNGTAQTIKVNKTVQYIAFVFDPITTGDTNARPKEIELWSADAQAAFTPVDLTDASLGKYTAFGAVTLNPSTLIPTAANFGASSNDSTLTKLQYITSNVAGSHEDFNPNSNYGAFQFTFDQMYYIGDVLIDSDLWTYDQDWAVYASTTSANLYSPESLIVDNISAKYAQGNRVTLNTYAQYVAIVFKGYTRVRAIRIYTADSTGVPLPFVSENVLLNRSGCSNALPFYKNISTGAVTDDASFYYPVNESRFIAYTDGNISTHNDMRGFNTGTYRVGARYELTEPTYIGSIVLYASIGQSYPEAYSIYASSSLEDLLSDSSKLVDNQGTTGAAIVAPVNDYIQYIAFVCESYTGNPRFREIEAWTAQVPENYKPPFASENALRTSLDTATGKVQYISSGNIVNEGVVTAAQLPLFTDGDTATHVDLSGSLDWGEDSRKPGAEFELTESKYIGEIRLYAGFSDLPETYTVYASDSLETLYTAENKLADGVTAAGETVTIAVNKEVQYIAFFCDSYTGNPRFKEIEAWTAEEPEIFVSENALYTSLESATAKVQYISSGNIVNEGVVTAAQLPLFTDGDTATHVDLSGSLDWGEDSRKPGAEFELTESKYIGEIRLYAGFSNLPETYTVYASGSLGTLYTAENKLADGVTAAGETVTIAVNKEVQYIAFFCDSYTGNPRFKEIEAWTADPNAVEPVEPEEPTVPGPINDGVTRVLTIGNSFAENASIYASEIAYANGEQMMFGYLKYPSCTLQRHLYDAENDVAEFKFRVTPPNGTGTTVADGTSTFYSIKQALFYTHWDVIVFQQESSNARNYATYSYLADLIDYVKEYYPEARLMFHQVWRWGEWESDQWDLIKSASEKAAYENGLEIIPSGLAFENARTAMDSVNFLNEDDGHYQHANRYGQYIEGCCYTAAIFGIEIDSATFASHPYVNDTGDVATFTAAANAAIAYYNSNGDIDGVAGLGAGDLALMMQVLLESNEDEVDMTLADANKDSVVNILDLIWLKKELAKVAD